MFFPSHVIPEGILAGSYNTLLVMKLETHRQNRINDPEAKEADEERVTWHHAGRGLVEVTQKWGDPTMLASVLKYPQMISHEYTQHT